MIHHRESTTNPPISPPLRPQPDVARDAALQRVCDGFTTTISPLSAERLVNLLSTKSYVQAA